MIENGWTYEIKLGRRKIDTEFRTFNTKEEAQQAARELIANELCEEYEKKESDFKVTAFQATIAIV